MTFRVGQKVECIAHAPLHIRSSGTAYAEKGTVYTVRGFARGYPHIMYLFELVNPLHPTLGVEWGFAAKYFRPIVDSKSEAKTDISIFKKMLIPAKEDACTCS